MLNSLTVQEIYEREVVSLPLADRLRLASLILRDATEFPQLAPTVDESTEWSEEDMRELSAQSLRRFDEREAIADNAANR